MRVEKRKSAKLGVVLATKEEEVSSYQNDRGVVTISTGTWPDTRITRINSVKGHRAVEGYFRGKGEGEKIQ